MKVTKSLLLLVITLTSCNNSNNTSESEKVEPEYFNNLYTNEILDKYEFAEFYQSLKKEYYDSIFGAPHISLRFDSIVEVGDSTVAYFKYDLRVGNEYKVRSLVYDKIGMTVAPRVFRTIHGDSVQIGGKQPKPTLINLWFIGCRGCVEEMPALNRLEEKYRDRVNFIALTSDDKKDVLKFLNKKEFNYQHIASEDWKYDETSMRSYIKSIESYPYPESIFLDRNGTIRYVEGVLPHGEDLDSVVVHFESIIKELLLPVD